MKLNVEQMKFISSRPHISLNELFEVQNCKADLLYEAALGNLTIYIKPIFNWKVGAVCSLSSIFLRVIYKGLANLTLEEAEELQSDFPEFNDVDSFDELMARKPVVKIGYFFIRDFIAADIMSETCFGTLLLTLGARSR